MNDDPKPEDAVVVQRAADALEAPMEADLKTHKNTARLGQDVQAKIGQQLRAMYADVVDQGVPERFVELLRRLGEARQTKGN
jgi:hypothetical protein